MSAALTHFQQYTPMSVFLTLHIECMLKYVLVQNVALCLLSSLVVVVAVVDFMSLPYLRTF